MIIVHDMMNEGPVLDRLLDWMREQPEFERVYFSFAGANTERVHIDLKPDDQSIPA